MDSVETISEHVCRTLPDSISERKRVLVALRNVMTDSHHAADNIMAQIAAIETLEKLQTELPLKFKGK